MTLILNNNITGFEEWTLHTTPPTETEEHYELTKLLGIDTNLLMFCNNVIIQSYLDMRLHSPEEYKDVIQNMTSQMSKFEQQAFVRRLALREHEYSR